MKLLWIGLLLVVSCLVLEGAVPQLTDFNTNQFGTTGGIVTIKNGALVTNLVGAGSGSTDWTNTAWGLQPILTNSLVDIHHGTNAIWVNQLATGGNGTTNNPWTGLEGKTLNTPYTHYYWPQGYYKVTNTLDLLGQNTYHSGEAGTVIKYYGTNVAIRFANLTSWTQGAVFENFRIDCTDAVRPVSPVSAIILNPTGSLPRLATATSTNHGYVTGEIVDIFGANEVDYNGTRVVTVVDTNTFTYLVKEGSTISTNATGTLQSRKSSVCLQCIGLRNNYFRNIALANASLGMNLQACVTGDWDNIRMTKFEEPGGALGAWTIIPVHGLLVGKRTGSVAHGTSAETFRNLIIEGASDFGIVLFECMNMSFDEGTSEVNGGGVMIGSGALTSGSQTISFIGWDNEGNSPSGLDWYIFANECSVIYSVSSATNWIAGGRGNSIIGGRHPNVLVGPSTGQTVVQSVEFGTFADTGQGTRLIADFAEAGVGLIDQTPAWRITPWSAGGIGAGGTLSIDASVHGSVEASYLGDMTIANPTNPTDGQRLYLRLKHPNNTTVFTNGLDTKWNLPTWIPTPTLNIANGITYLDAQYDGTRDLWDILRWDNVSANLNVGTTNTVLHGNAAGNPAYASVTEYDLGLTDITTANFSTNMHGFTPKGETNDQKYLQATGIWAVPTGNGVGANASEPYVTIGNVGSLSDERALTSGQVSITDNGAGSTVTIGATTDTPRFLRMGLGKAVDATASLTTVAPIISSDGSLSAPSFGWGSETNMGFYRRFAGGVEFCTGGHSYQGFGTSFRLASVCNLSWANGFAESGTGDLFLARDGIATLQMGVDAAAPIAQRFKAHDASGTNIAGANLTLSGGSGTGTGAGGDLITSTSVSSNASGSSLQIYSTRHYESAKPSPMTNSTANPVFNILIGSTHYFGCKIFATTFAADAGGDFQALSEELIISAVNKSGTISNTVSASWGSTLAASVASTLTTTWTAVTSGASLDIKCTPVSSLTPTTYYTKWKVDVLSNDPATIAPYR